MLKFIGDYYLIFKSLHLISMVCWMAGLLYLPRLFVYHCQVKSFSESSLLFKKMERLLSKRIMTPSMLSTWVFGLLLLTQQDLSSKYMGWLHLKILLVFGLSGYHGALIFWMKDFKNDKNSHSETFYRIINEIPAILLVFIIFLVVIKPF